jgi:lysozyme
MPERMLGIDVSHHQGQVDWFLVAQSSVKFAFAKATEGSAWVDPQFETNSRALREVGLFRGAYHFARPGGDPDTQAVHFHSVVGALGFRDLPPVLDLEVSDGHGPAYVLDWAAAFVKRAEALFQRTLLIYTGGFWRSELKNPLLEFFGARPLWYAAYTPNPHVPASWHRWTFWQFSDGTQNGGQHVPGVRGPVDQNRFDGGEAGLNRLCDSQRVPLPTPVSVPVPGWPGVHFVWPSTPPIAGAGVRAFQERLVTLGFSLDVDGIYGPQSKAACLAFQRDRGLFPDGIVGPRTWERCFQD